MIFTIIFTFMRYDCVYLLTVDEITGSILAILKHQTKQYINRGIPETWLPKLYPQSPQYNELISDYSRRLNAYLHRDAMSKIYDVTSIDIYEGDVTLDNLTKTILWSSIELYDMWGGFKSTPEEVINLMNKEIS